MAENARDEKMHPVATPVESCEIGPVAQSENQENADRAKPTLDLRDDLSPYLRSEVQCRPSVCQTGDDATGTPEVPPLPPKRHWRSKTRMRDAGICPYWHVDCGTRLLDAFWRYRKNMTVTHRSGRGDVAINPDDSSSTSAGKIQRDPIPTVEKKRKRRRKEKRSSQNAEPGRLVFDEMAELKDDTESMISETADVFRIALAYLIKKLNYILELSRLRQIQNYIELSAANYLQTLTYDLIFLMKYGPGRWGEYFFIIIWSRMECVVDIGINRLGQITLDMFFLYASGQLILVGHALIT